MTLERDDIAKFETPQLIEVSSLKSFQGLRTEIIQELLKREGLEELVFISLHTVRNDCKVGFLRYTNGQNPNGKSNEHLLQYLCIKHKVLSAAFTLDGTPLGFEEIVQVDSK